MKTLYQNNKIEHVLMLALKTTTSLPTSIDSNIKDGNHTTNNATASNPKKRQVTNTLGTGQLFMHLRFHIN